MSALEMIGLLIAAFVLAQFALVFRSHAAQLRPEVSPRAAKLARVCFVATAAASAVLLVVIVIGVEPYFRPQRCLDDAERAGMPVIEAIDRFVAARGKPPESLEDVVPEFMVRIPPTECGPYEGWDYIGPKWLLRDEPNSWRLSVELNRFPFGYGSDERFEFNSWDRRWIYRR